MTRDDIIRMAREAGFVESNPHSDIIVRHSNGSWVSVHDLLDRFAALVTAAEREACAEILDRNAQVCQSNSMLRDVLEGNAAAIRARSQA